MIVVAELPGSEIDYELIELLTGLTPGQDVLDLGCGTGRLTSQILTRIQNGHYLGVDVSIMAQLQAELGQERFATINARHVLYNPDGVLEAKDATIPAANASFDLVLAIGLFTHLGEDWLLRYLDESARLLRQGGCLLASFFLISPYALEMMQTGRSQIDFRYGFDHVLWPDPQVPLEQCSAYYDWFVFTALGQAGLKMTGCVWGSWCGCQSVSFQDLIIATH